MQWQFTRIVWFVWLFLLAMPGSVFARSWTDVNGRTVEAELEDYRNGLVILATAGGGRTAISWDRLSSRDQRYVNFAMASRKHGHGLLPKLGVGLLFGLPLLFLGKGKKRLGLGLLTFVLCMAGSSLFGVVAALPICVLSLIVLGMVPE